MMEECNSAQLTLVVPCYNEEDNIPVFFPKLLDFAEKNGFLVIAVNDGSRDHTLEKLQEFAKIPCFSILSHKMNQGYGAAIKTGLWAVKTPFAITIDADGQHRLDDVRKCFDLLLEKDADMVVGARKNNESDRYRTFGKFIIRAFASMLLELSVSDMNSGMKCYRMAETRRYLDLCPNTMAFSDVILLLMVNDQKLVTETWIEVAPRIAGKSTIRTKTALITIAEILSLSILLRPLTTFGILSLFFMTLGVFWSIWTYWNSQTLASSAVMLIILGFLCFIFGLLAEQVSKLRKSLADK